MTSPMMQWQQILISNTADPSMLDSLVTPSHRGLAYADGFFTTMRVAKGLVSWQAHHQQRIARHICALGLQYSDTDDKVVWHHVEHHAHQIQHGIIKIVMYRQHQEVRGYAFSAQPQDNGVVVWLGYHASSLDMRQSVRYITIPNSSAIPVQPHRPAICLDSQLASLPATLVGLKTLARTDSVLAAGELQRVTSQHNDPKWRNAEGIVSDLSGNWIEAVSGNVFYQLVDAPDVWYTPPIEQAGVDGVMRQVIQQALGQQGATVLLRHLTTKDLSNLAALTVTNAVRGLIPISSLCLPNASIVSLATTVILSD